MSHPNTPHISILTRGIAISLGMLLIPLTLTPTGIEENLACGSEIPDEECMRFIGGWCLVDGEFIQNFRIVT